MKPQSLSRIETIIATLVFISVSIGLGRMMAVHFYVQAADSAFFVDLLNKLAQGRGFVSSAFNSSYSIFPILADDAESYCRSGFISLYQNVSGLRWHAYLIAYPLALLTLIPGATALGVAVASIAVSFMGSLLLLWLTLRRHSVPMVVAAAFLVLVFFCKPWSDAVIGQFYFDRLFLLPGVALVLGVHARLTGRGFSLAWIVILTAICALVTERPALMVGCFLIGYPILVRGVVAFRSRSCRLLMVLGLACCAYTILYVALLQDSPYRSAFAVSAVIAALKSSLVPGGAYYAPTLKLFGVLLPFFILAAFEWRLCLVAVGALMPNLMLTIGGAEKNNFFTHYHMAYLPFLLAAAAVGLMKVWSILTKDLDLNMQGMGWRRWASATALATGLCLAALYSDRINVADLSRTFVFDNPGDRVLPKSVLGISPNPVLDVWADQGRFYRDFVAAIPDGSTVATPEWFQPALVQRNGMVIDYAPIGLGTSRYMIMVYSPAENSELLLQVPSFGVQAEVSKIRACVQSRIDGLYTITQQQDRLGATYRIYKARN